MEEEQMVFIALTVGDVRENDDYDGDERNR